MSTGRAAHHLCGPSPPPPPPRRAARPALPEGGREVLVGARAPGPVPVPRPEARLARQSPALLCPGREAPLCLFPVKRTRRLRMTRANPSGRARQGARPGRGL